MRNQFRRFIAMCRRLISHWQVPGESSHVGRISTGEPATDETDEERQAQSREENNREGP